MKQCPKCGNSYTDDTLRFCLEDGTPLAVADEQPTVIRGDDPNKTEQLPSNITAQPGMRVDIPTAHQHAAQPTMPSQHAQQKSSPVIKIVIAVVALGFLLILGAGVLGGIFYFYTGSKQSEDIARQPTPPNQPSPAASPWSSPSGSPSDSNDDEKKLEEEIAKLLKQIGDASNSSSDDSDVPDIGRKATVNSPKDGFLALRNLPSSDIGQRIAKIPHGEKLSILTCAPQAVTIGGKSGHWCMTTYDKKSGWVFDVAVTFDANN